MWVLSKNNDVVGGRSSMVFITHLHRVLFEDTGFANEADPPGWETRVEKMLKVVSVTEWNGDV